ncbi:MAG: hypothetical protein LBS81_05475 [Endomicrobium sp.]|nr:hypothetical protein [Endomicrobium sp.]
MNLNILPTLQCGLKLLWKSIKIICFLRGGYSCPLNNDNQTLGEWYQRNLTLGFGFNIKLISINYAWFPFGQLGCTNIFSLQA